MNAVAELGPLAGQGAAAAAELAQQAGGLVGLPHPRQEVATQELRQHAGVNLVGLDLGLGNGLGGQRVRTTTSPTRGRSTSATAQQLVVASIATWSAGRRAFRRTAPASAGSRQTAHGARPCLGRRGCTPRPRACGRPGPRNVQYKESWEFSSDYGKTEGNPLGFSTGAVAGVWTTSPFFLLAK